MGLINNAKKDIERITSNKTNGFGVEFTLKQPDPSTQTATITGLYAERNLDVIQFESIVNSKKAHISFSEKFVIDAGYPIRNDAGEIDLDGHQVSTIDIVTGVLKKYVIGAWYPNTGLGLITCILNDLKE